LNKCDQLGTGFVIQIESEVMNAMKKSPRDHAQRFIATPIDLFQGGRFAGRLFQHDRHDLQSYHIVPKTNDALKRLLDDDRRKHSRIPVNHVITYLILPEQGKNSVELSTAELCDISDAGMSMITDSCLQLGQIVQFCERPVYRRGIVRWVTVMEAGVCFKAGIEFIDGIERGAGGQHGRDDALVIT
jgi:hypothetical protein